MKKNLLSSVLILAVLFWGSALAFADKDSAAKDRERVLRSVDVFKDLLAIPEKGIPPTLIHQAQAIAIIPGFLKAAYVVGGEHGNGVVCVRRDDGRWSDPSFISMTGGSIGFQIGVEKADIILVFKDRRSVETIDQGKFTLGGSASVAAGPVGRSAQASTDIKFEAEVYSYSKAKGIFAGISINGASLSMDRDANQRFYRNFDIKTDDILFGSPKAPEAAGELRSALDQYAK